MEYRRPILSEVLNRMKEPRQFIQVLAGPRQVGKSTLMDQVLAESSLPNYLFNADGIDEDEINQQLSIEEVSEICEYLKGKCEVECFVHGAMCISYSGRCLLSNYLTGRDSNCGACVQACRWKYSLR